MKKTERNDTLLVRKRRQGRDAVRHLVRRRDKFTCQECGLQRTPEMVQLSNKKIVGLKGRIKSLDVHHLNGLCGKKSKGYDSAKELPNLITLCHKCHYNRHDHSMKKGVDN